MLGPGSNWMRLFFLNRQLGGDFFVPGNVDRFGFGWVYTTNKTSTSSTHVE